jgi:hypothetical protein
LWNAFKRITARCSQIEKLAIYSGTATRFLRPRLRLADSQSHQNNGREREFPDQAPGISLIASIKFPVSRKLFHNRLLPAVVPRNPILEIISHSLGPLRPSCI